MPNVSVPQANEPGVASIYSTGSFVVSVVRSMQIISRHYAALIEDSRLNADMLVGLLYIGQESPHAAAEANLTLWTLDANAVLEQLMSAGFVALDATQTLRPTGEARDVFRRLKIFAQSENRRWRESLQATPGGRFVLDEFLKMLQSSSQKVFVNR